MEKEFYNSHFQALTRQLCRGKMALNFQTGKEMSAYKFLVRNKNYDPRMDGYLRDAHALGFHHLQIINVQDLYFIEGQLSQEGLQQLALKLLTDPVTQAASW